MTPSPVRLLTHGLITLFQVSGASYAPTASQLVDFRHCLHCGALMDYFVPGGGLTSQG